MLALLILLTLCAGIGRGLHAAPPSAPGQPAVDFNRQILPILSENCFACHGPDAQQRKAGLRLDTKEGGRTELRHGGFAIVPGKSAESVLVQRITASEAGQRMPPAKTGKHLTPQQIDLLRQWIDGGAVWNEHWAFVPPHRTALPKVANGAWPKMPIDYFILARLEAERLHPAQAADRITLLRRVTLDLTGLPPTQAEVDAFLADRAPEAYEKVVDRLLESPAYGEHLGRYWLDAVRYGDTHGMHLDNYREIWPFRDWVIKSFNNNLPFDRFIVDQIAGDMLPNATLEEIVASGYNRCHVTTNEGGSIDEEIYVRNVDDRVDTTGIVFLGLTTGCARCHDHKYDPIKTKDYYQLFAFFNSLDDKPLDGNAAHYPPTAKLTTPPQAKKLAELDQKAAELKQAIAKQLAQVKLDEGKDVSPPREQEARPTEYVWVDDDLPPGVRAEYDGGAIGVWNFVTKPGHPVYSGSKSVMQSAGGVSQHFFENANPGLRVGAGDKFFVYVYLDPAWPTKELMLQWKTDAIKHRAYWGQNLIPFGADGTAERRSMGPLPPLGKWTRLEVEAEKVGLKPGSVITGLTFIQYEGTVFWDKAGLVTQTPQGVLSSDSFAGWLKLQETYAGAGLPEPIRKIVKLQAAKRDDKQNNQLREYFIAHAYAKLLPVFEPLTRELATVEKEREQLDEQIPQTLVSKERKEPRPAYILKRGEYDQRGDKVERATPGFLPPLPKDAPRDRLGFARWLVSPNHPLTARVAVNRFWQQLFGTGLVKTSEDFGAQGEPPSHPELLDWLAVEFREDGWDVKRLLKTIVLSATYRQSSRIVPDRLAKDPANRLLSRGPRFRLDAEMLRDQALSVSGLLVEHVGGASVKPPQPPGLWEAVGYTESNTARFKADTGLDRVHRRSLYTFWKRTSPPPQMNAFDAPSREACTVRRERTDTPLQALLLLNEEQYVECARALAERTMHHGGADPEARISYMFRLATCRKPDARELRELMALWNDNRKTYKEDVLSARKLITVGESKPDPKLDPSELAAWTMVANVVLNLDEVLNKS